VTSNASSNFLMSVCAQSFLCATFYQKSSLFITTSMKYVQKACFKGKFMLRSKFLVRFHLTTCEHAQ